MSPPPRRLSFAVGTSLLTASLATGASGCKTAPPVVNTAAPEEEVFVNTVYVDDEAAPEEPAGPEEEAEDEADAEDVDGPPSDVHVNTHPDDGVP